MTFSLSLLSLFLSWSHYEIIVSVGYCLIASVGYCLNGCSTWLSKILQNETSNVERENFRKTQTTRNIFMGNRKLRYQSTFWLLKFTLITSDESSRRILFWPYYSNFEQVNVDWVVRSKVIRVKRFHSKSLPLLYRFSRYV